MNDQSPTTPVIFNEATRTFQFQLLPSGCHNLLLSNDDPNGIMLCHRNKDELEKFRKKLISLNDDLVTNRHEKSKAIQKKMIAAALFAVFICFYVYANDFFSGGQLYRWLFSFITILVLIVLYKIAVKHLFGTVELRDPARLQCDLDLIIIHNRIRDEFPC